MLSSAYGLVIPPIAKLAKHTAVCAPLMFSPHDDDAVMTSTCDVLEVSVAPRSNSHMQRIGEWAALYDLNEEETDQLRLVLTDYPPQDVSAELAEELRCIIAARKLAMIPELDAADLERIQEAFDSGRIHYAPQDVD